MQYNVGLFHLSCSTMSDSSICHASQCRTLPFAIHHNVGLFHLPCITMLDNLFLIFITSVSNFVYSAVRCEKEASDRNDFEKCAYFLFAYYSTKSMLLPPFLHPHNLKYCNIVMLFKRTEEEEVNFKLIFKKKILKQMSLTSFLHLTAVLFPNIRVNIVVLKWQM